MTEDNNSNEDSFKDLIKKDKNFKELKDDKINPYDHKKNNTSINSSSENQSQYNKNNHLNTQFDNYISNNSTNHLSQHLWRPLVSSDDYLFYFKDGVQNRTVRKFRAGKIRVEAILDLHQKNKEQASESLIKFIKNSCENELRCVCIIHGKSIRAGSSHPILKNLINHWLHDLAPVLGFCSCPQNMGGTGAVLVLLKRVI